MIAGRLLTLVCALVVSLLVAYLLQLQLAIGFNADLEHLGAMAFLAVVANVSILTLGVALIASAEPRALRAAALTLMGLVLAGAMVLLVATATGRRTPEAMAQDLPLLAQMIVPSLAAILVQWLLVRGRRRRELQAR